MMRTRSFRRGLPAILAVTGLLVSTGALGETIDCVTVSSLPATISSQGIYCLTDNLATSQTSGNAITITANNVTLDLNGWKVGGQAAGTSTTAIGIYSTGNNVTIRNGIVRGFYQGLVLTGRGAFVHGLLVDKNTYTGIRTTGDGASIENNQIVDIGGATTATDVDAIGIFVAGTGSLVNNNTVSGLTATGAGFEWAINFGTAATYSTARNNIVSDAARPSGGGTSVGIRVGGTAGITMLNNSSANFDFGYAYANSATGLYARNTATDCTTAFGGTGTAGGTSNFSN